jgi:hypothetical protein
MTNYRTTEAPTHRRLIGVLQIALGLSVMIGGIYWMGVVSNRANAAYSTSDTAAPSSGAPASPASQ